MTVAPHPATFTDVIIERFAQIVHEYAAACRQVRVLDPFAGIGGIHKIPDLLQGCDVNVLTTGIELEANWASAHPRTQQGNALRLPFKQNTFDFIMTSPCYGNRMADHHNAQDGSKRITYRHYYGEELQPMNAGMLQWSDEYRQFHSDAWKEALRVLKPGGIFVVNISNHIRKGEEMPVVEWHLLTLLNLRLFVERVEQIQTRRMKFGDNAEKRVAFEHILILRKGI